MIARVTKTSSNPSNREVIVLDEDGNLIGNMPFKSADDLAAQKGLDLIEVNKQGGTSVYKLMDYGKWLYEQKKKIKHKKALTHQLKEMKFGMRIDKHDEDTKIRHIKDFLAKSYDVRVVVEMRGREKSHANLATMKLNSILTALDGLMRQEETRKTSVNVSVLIHAVKN